MPIVKRHPQLGKNVVEYKCDCGTTIMLLHKDDDPLEKLIKCWNCLSKENFLLNL